MNLAVRFGKYSLDLSRRSTSDADGPWPADDPRYYTTLSRTSAAGVRVTPETALWAPAVFACVKLISQTIASQPIHVYRRTAGGKAREDDHPLAFLLNHEPNPELNAFEFWETMVAHLELRGNAYAEIQRTAATGDIFALWPLHPDRMTPKRLGGRVLYEYRLPSGEPKNLLGEQVLHLRTLMGTGLTGLSPIDVARETIGLTLAATDFGARFFSNDATPSGVLQAPAGLKMKPAEKDAFVRSWIDAHAAMDKKHSIGVLPQGIEWKATGVTNDQAQFLETRKFQAIDICRVFGVQPHKIASLDNATFSNIEHQGIEFREDTILPRTRRIEQGCNRSLLAASEKRAIYVEYLLDNIARADTPSRFRSYALALTNGIMSINEVRDRENMNPVEGGDVHLVPLNLIPATDAGADGGTPNPANDGDEGTRSAAGNGTDGTEGTYGTEECGCGTDHGESRAGAGGQAARLRLRARFRAPLEKAWRKVVKREAADVRKLAERYLSMGGDAGFGTAIEGYFGDVELLQAITGTVGPVLEGYGAAIAEAAAGDVGNGRARTDRDGHGPELREDGVGAAEAVELALARLAELVAEIGGKHVATNLADLRAALEDSPDALADVMARLDEWEAELPEKLTRRETVYVDGLIAMLVWGAMGRSKITWMTNDPCEICEPLSGKVVGLGAGEPFLGQGGKGSKGFVAATDVLQPPLHAGCQCSLIGE